LISIIKTTLEREPRSRFTLVYGNRETGSIIFREALERLKNTYMDRLSIVHTLSRESRNLPLLDGRIDRVKAKALLESLVPAGQHDEFFLCGPKGMIDAVREALLEKNVPPSCIHYELFTPPDQHIENRPERMPIQAQGGRCSVVVSLDSKSTTFEMSRDRDTLLEAVRRVRPEVPYACEGGVCATCRAKLVEGRVNMQLNFALEESDLSSGFVLTCQSVPLTDRIVIDFDAL
jgi:ring-1,2-phenylacetyl-CoA epoxidase subunit PaaE